MVHGSSLPSVYRRARYVVPRVRGLANVYFENMFEMGSAVGELTSGVLASFLPIQTVFQLASATLLLDALTLVM